jgi:Ankyrin repeats (3 copies)
MERLDRRRAPRRAARDRVLDQAVPRGSPRPDLERVPAAPCAIGDDDGGETSEGAPIEVVDALLGAWPQAIYETDHRGRLAIHLACQSPITPLPVIRRLVKEWPESLPRREVDEGQSPLHYAIKSGMPQGVIEFLTDTCPRTVREPNYHGFLALHLLRGVGPESR